MIVKRDVKPGDPDTVCSFLAVYSELPKSRIKDAMVKGAVWLKRKKCKELRIRRATAGIKPGDTLSLFYDEAVLALTPPQALCIEDRKHYSVWFKPAGLMSQGTRYGDHCSLLRQAELFFKPRRKVFLIHRLDREASGVILIAHGKDAAGRLTHLFQKQKIVKRYRAIVLGNIATEMPSGTIEKPLDGKAAVTEFAVEDYNAETNTSSLNIVIRTGRKHQIRRHFEMIGFPVMGDPSYGKGNKNKEGMQLTAAALEFQCPISGDHLKFDSPGPLIGA
jgi:tRNA pseudouridine32 synthase/23S rRNA pseudouridine746 synthase